MVGKVSMNFEFIEHRKTGDKVVKFRGVGIADEVIVHYKGKGSRVSVVTEEWWRFRCCHVG